MRTDLTSFIFGSENRKKIVKNLLEYRTRQWSCSSMEEITRLPHATVFRALQGLHQLGLLKSTKINKKDILYELVQDSPWISEIEQLLTIEMRTAKKIARDFAAAIKQNHAKSIILYGSSIAGDATHDSDIDILVILSKHGSSAEKSIHDKAAELSSKYNKTISVIVMDVKEMKKEKNGRFLQSVRMAMKVIYGKGLS